jgi:DNA-binding GntR family transcriptional regulator
MRALCVQYRLLAIPLRDPGDFGKTPMEPMSIYEDLRSKIIWLDMKPGAALNLVEIAQAYGVSRNPVMIALTRLDAEELVVRQGVHFVVSPLTVDRMREMTEIRSVLELQAVLWALNRMSPQGLAELKAFRKEILGLNRAAAKRRIVELDLRFHRLIYRETRNQQLAVLLERLLAHYLRFWLASPREIEAGSFFAEALDIIQAFEDRDEARLRAATEQHIRISLDTIIGISK